MTHFNSPHPLRPLALTAALLAACPGAQDPADSDTAVPATTTSPSTTPDSTETEDDASTAAPTSTSTALPTSTGEGTTAGPEACIPITLDAAPVTVVGLGAHPSDAEVCFDLPAGVLGFTVIGRSDAGDFGFDALVGPQDEAELMDYNLPGTALNVDSESLELFGAGFGPLALFAVPQRSAAQAMPPAPGPWRLRLGADTVIVPAPEVELELWLRRVPGDVPDRLNVNVFASATTIDADAAKALVNQAFADFAGLELGAVEVFVLPDAATVIDDAIEFAALSVATAGVDPRPALNVIMATDLSTGVFKVAGTTSSIPGPARRHGTAYSALAIQISDDPTFDAIVLAHEAGHYAGLLHTSEISVIGTHDALGDTPECSDPDDFENCPDRDNLMFYAVSLLDAPQSTLSPQQRTVIHASALYEGDAPGLGAATLEAPLPRRSQDGSGALRQLSSPTLAALVGCGRGLQAPHPPHPSLEEGRALLRLAAAPGYSLMLRRRALALAGLATDAAGVAVLGQTAQDPAAPRALRLGAVHGLWAAGQRVRVAALADDPDLAVAQSARGLLRR